MPIIVLLLTMPARHNADFVAQRRWQYDQGISVPSFALDVLQARYLIDTVPDKKVCC